MGRTASIMQIKMFLYFVLELIRTQAQEDVAIIEEKMQDGVATYLSEKYKNVFDNIGCSYNSIQALDDFYSNQCGCIDERKYIYGKMDGLYIIVGITINQI